MKHLLLAVSIAALACACDSRTTTDQTPAAPAPKVAAAPASDPTPTAAPAPASLGEPEECLAYVKRLDACLTKAAATNKATADIFRQQMDTTRAHWRTITDRTALATACKAAGFAQASAMLKCE